MIEVTAICPRCNEVLERGHSNDGLVEYYGCALCYAVVHRHGVILDETDDDTGDVTRWFPVPGRPSEWEIGPLGGGDDG
jgi:hypothetical protein